MKALIYLRVSTEEQAEKGYSLNAQRDECINKAFELGCSSNEISIFGDEGVSGALLERPQLMAAMELLKNKNEEVKFFICYDSSRLSRNAAHQLILVDEIKRSGAQLFFIRNSYQDNAEGRFQLTVMAAVDEYERARLRLRTEMGKRAKAAQHKLTHNPGIYGYDFDTKTDTLSINKESSQNVKLIYNLLIEERKGPAEIAELLNELELMSPRMKLWSRVTVRRILSNPSYMGTLYIRRYDTRDCHLNKYKEKGEKKKVAERPQSEWISIDIPPLIDSVTWQKAQNILKNSKLNKHYNRKENIENFILTPLIKCEICGSSMRTKCTTKGEHCYRYYVCPSKYNVKVNKKCDSKLIPAEKAEKAVWDFFCETIALYIRKEINIKQLIDNYIADSESVIKNIINKKEKTIVEKERIVMMFQKGYINEAEMERRLSAQMRKLSDLESKAEHREETGKNLKKDLWDRMSKENAAGILKTVIGRLDNESRRYMLGLIFKEITVHGDVVTIS